MTGTWMQVMAHGWVMATLTSSNFMLGLVYFASGLPMLLLSLWGGALADRLDKRAIVQVTLLAQIALALTLAWLLVTHQLTIWHVIALSLVGGVVGAFEMPAAQALVPDLVEPEEIGAALAIDRAIFHATRLVGPALAGWLVGQWGAAAALVANAISFLPLMLAIATLPARPPDTPEQAAVRGGAAAAGLRYVLADRRLTAMVALIAATVLLVFPAMVVTLPLYATRELGLDAAAMGFLMASTGFGSMAGSIALLGIPASRRRAVMLLALPTAGFSLVGMANAYSLPMAIPTMLLVAIGVSTLVGLANITIQEQAPPAMRGRVSAVAGLAFMGTMPFAGLLMPAAADFFGLRPTLAVCGASYVVLGFAVLALVHGAQGASGAPSESEGALPSGGSNPSGNSSTAASEP